MVLTHDDHSAIVAGFASAGFTCRSVKQGASNPMRIEIRLNGEVKRYRLWCFDVRHGGGGAEVRAADEFRVQVTNGPETMSEYDQGESDLLIGYDKTYDVVVAFDRRWLEAATLKNEASGSHGSNSAQVKEKDIQDGRDKGIHYTTKGVNFGTASIVTMLPKKFPAFLIANKRMMSGDIRAEDLNEKGEDTGLLDYIWRRGFVLEPDLVARYVASIAAKPFVLLAGITGTGKSKLAELVAEFYTLSLGTTRGAAAPTTGDRYVFELTKGFPDRDRSALVAVRPEWADSQPIFGYVNAISGEYESTLALDLILRADEALKTSTERPKAPRHFLLLDEMNLARVEYYFSDWLACSESRRIENATVVQQPVPLHRSKTPLNTELASANGVSRQIGVPQDLALPTNVVVTGTLNIDESTFGISPKVLDRAMVIEYGDVDLDSLREGSKAMDAKGYRFPEELPPFRIASSEDYRRLPVGAHRHLVAINNILAPTRMNIGYRGANEVALFMALYNAMLPEDAADVDWLRSLDGAILQKVLPRLSGNRMRLEKPLLRLSNYLKDFSEIDSGVLDEPPKSDAPARLPVSYRRALEMLEGLRDFGFVSFFK